VKLRKILLKKAHWMGSSSNDSKVEDDFELWLENSEEFYPCVNITPSELQKVAHALNIRLQKVLDGPYDREKTLRALEAGEPKPLVIKVTKRRQTRLWSNGHSKVKAEIAEIS
jgi:hypothetical protein